MSGTNDRLSSLRYTIEEQLLVSKTGHEADCEDAIYTGPYFVAVIDGATSRTQRRWDGKTNGRIAAETIHAAFDQIPYDATAYQATAMLTKAISNLYGQYGVSDIARADPIQRAVASFVAVSLWRREIWFVGDCQCLLLQSPETGLKNEEFSITSQLARQADALGVEKSNASNEFFSGDEPISNITNVKAVDDIVANARSLFLEGELARGKTVAELLQYDTSRDFVLPLMMQQMFFQNKPATGQYWYAVIDGFDVPDEGIYIQSLPADIEAIVLASDGYPYLKGSLAEAEQALQALLQADPLLFRQYKATKGMTAGLVSFDDRAYIKVTISHS